MTEVEQQPRPVPTEERTLSAKPRDPRVEYWVESLASSFEEHGIQATPEQIAAVAEDVEISRDCMSMAFYVPENPLAGELQRTKAALAHEQKLVFCDVCLGSGREKYNVGPWGVNTQCWKCHGNGKHLP